MGYYGYEDDSDSSDAAKNVEKGQNSGSQSPASRSHSPSRSRSGSPQSLNSHQNLPTQTSDGLTTAHEDQHSRSQSPNLQIDDHASNRSRSNSGSPSPSLEEKSDSRSSGGSKSQRSSAQRSRSHSKSPSGSPVQKRRHIISSPSGSENDEANKNDRNSNVKIKKSNIIDSESENDDVIPKVGVTDIFGDADDISASSEDEQKSHEKTPTRSRSRSKSRSPKSRFGSARSRSGTPRSDESDSRSSIRSQNRSSARHRSRSRSPPLENYISSTQKEDEVETAPDTRIDVEIPRIVTDLGRDVHFAKLPNFLSVDTRPFDPETYEDEIDEEETMDEEGRQRIKLKVSNTIRWRELMDKNGDMIKESNARFVRWSDGSMSLHLGNEIFDVYKQPLHGDHNHMFIRQGTGLQGQAVFRTKLTFRPHSTESFTHKKMTMSLADRSQKTSGIKILTQVGKDPTTDRLFQLKKEEEKLRQAMRSQHRPHPKKKKIDTQNANNVTAYQQDEGSDDENAFSVNAIKNSYKKGLSGLATASQKKSDLKASAIYSSDDDDGSDFEQRRHKKIDKAKAVKALRDSDSDSDDQQGTKKNENNSGSEGNDNDKPGSQSDSNSD